MDEQRQPDGKLRAIYWTPELETLEQEQVHNRKVESLALDILRQHGLQCGPRRHHFVLGTPNLIETMMKMIEGYEVALSCALADVAAPPLRPGSVSLLIKLVPEDQLAAVLVSLRTAAKQLHDEDNTALMHVTRFFAKLRKAPSPVQEWPGLTELVASLSSLKAPPEAWAE